MKLLDTCKVMDCLDKYCRDCVKGADACYGCGVDEAVCSIVSAKTVDVAPVEQGQFEDFSTFHSSTLFRMGSYMNEAKCSVCKRYMMWIDGHIRPEYCPHCGARLSVKQKE